MCKKLLILASLSLSLVAHAAEITYKGYTLDTETNIVTDGRFEWLQWDVTVGQSIETALTNYGAAGWQLATSAEVAEVFNTFFPPPTFIGDRSHSHTLEDDVGSFGAANQFIALFGDTYAAQVRSEALVGPFPTPSGRYNAAVVFDDRLLANGTLRPGRASLSLAYYVSDRIFTGGVALVRASGVPLTAAGWLIEAESMALGGGYTAEYNAEASGGQLIRRLASDGLPATASSQYTGPAGTYDIAVSYFDESDGRSSLALLLNGEMLDQWIADQDPECKDCASPGEGTLRTRVVARDVRLSPSDEITLQGTGDYYEYARFDKITVAPVSSITLEAEKMTIDAGYAVEANAAASGGQLIRRLDSGGYVATASTDFTGLAGTYDITVSYFDESDGVSSLAFLLNGEMRDQWVADEDPLCRDCASPGASTLRTRLVAKELRLVPSDEIALQGTGEHYEYARFDKITLAPVGFTTLEAEMMTLDDSFVVEINAAASGGQIIRSNGPADSAPGQASAVFMGGEGQYDITVSYFDEYDGVSRMAFFLNNRLLDRWLADENPRCRDCASPNERTLRSRVVAAGIEISPGDDIRLESTVNQYEYGRFDKVDFTPSLSP